MSARPMILALALAAPAAQAQLGGWPDPWGEWGTRTPPSTAEMRNAHTTATQAADAAREARQAASSAAGRSAYDAASAVGTQLGSWVGMAAEHSDEVRSALERATEGSPRARAALEDALERLSPQDAEAEPQAPPGEPEVPSSCGESEECGSCFDAAHARLNGNREALERLRILSNRTKKDVDSKIAFGDGASAVHGVSALAWQKERIAINRQMETFYRSVDRKYVELIGKVQESLLDLGRCEWEQFEEPDWYDRFGFIYYQFLADHYKRVP